MKSRCSSLALALGLLVVPPAAADEGATRARGVELYEEGLRQLRAGDAEAALEALEASRAVLPSPNTDLLRGHALRLLGRRVEAMAAYERVVRDAGARVRAGDTRFEATLADAGRWVAFLRNALGELTLELAVGKQGARALIDGTQIELNHDRRTGIARGRVWREPGRARVTVRGAGGTEHKRELVLAAGETKAVSFDLVPKPEPAGPAPLAERQRSAGPPLASWVAWGVGGAGFVVLAVAGGIARSKMSELDECAPGCSRAQADEAQTVATIANVGLAIGVAGVVVGGGIWLAAGVSEPSEAAPRAGSIRVGGAF